MSLLNLLLVILSTSTILTCYASRLAIQVNGGENEARAIAFKYGYTFEGQIGELEGVYQFNSGNRKMKGLVGQIRNEKKVGFIKRQVERTRDKKDFQEPTDPLWNEQWALHATTIQESDYNMRVLEAWIQGFTGEGVAVGVVDDGLQRTHPDLSANYDDNSSYDFVNYDNDPSPYYQFPYFDSHGTECAGVVSMSKSNGLCGVGVAYNAKVAGLRIFSSSHKGTTDSQEANALNYRYQNIDIYSNSWGPVDNGFTVDGPKLLTRLALQIGAAKGRQNKGSIFVWAAGNGGSKHDSCATDGYVNSIYTIAVGSVDSQGIPSSFDERCSAKMAVAFSFNAGTDETSHNPTTTLTSRCTESFTGTSAATPLLSGVIALALQANPSLTWRDVQYLIAYTSNSQVLMKEENARLWMTNGAGMSVSSQFGFGVIDAEAMVTRARVWTNVPPQLITLITPSLTTRYISSNSLVSINYRVNQSTQNDVMGSTNISFLEHVVVVVSLKLSTPSNENSFSSYDYYDKLYNEEANIDSVLYHNSSRRGDIKIILQSPYGTQSTLLPYRDRDFVNNVGFKKWSFMSVQYWGENPVGEWKLSVNYRGAVGSVTVTKIRIKLYGTNTVPESVRKIPEACPDSCKNNRCSDQSQCDTCKQLRDSQTLECLTECPHNVKRIGNYCIGNLTLETVTPSPSCQQASLTDMKHITSATNCISSSSSTSTTVSRLLVTKTPVITSILDQPKPESFSGSPMMHASSITIILILIFISIFL